MTSVLLALLGNTCVTVLNSRMVEPTHAISVMSPTLTHCVIPNKERVVDYTN